MRDKFLLRLGLVAAFLITALMFVARENLRKNWQSFLSVFENFRADVTQGINREERKRPLSTVVSETQLALYVGEPFKDFSQTDWQNFWLLIYGKHFMDNPRGGGWPKIYRQLTLVEIRSRLISMYPSPFSGFSDEQWGIFFGIILKQK